MTLGNYIKIEPARDKSFYEEGGKKGVVKLSFSNNGHYWTCIDLTRKELRKLRRTIKKYLKETKHEDLH